MFDKQDSVFLDLLISCDGLYGTYLENLLNKKALETEISLRYGYQLEKLRENQDWLIIGSPYKAFLIFTKDKQKLFFGEAYESIRDLCRDTQAFEKHNGSSPAVKTQRH
mgnify:CR=1 FL=1